MSDIWERMYGAWGVDPNADPDGAGFSNRAESIPGANPFEIGSFVSEYSVSTSGAISLSLPYSPSGGASTNRLPALKNILGLPYANLQSQAYASVAEPCGQGRSVYSRVKPGHAAAA